MKSKFQRILALILVMSSLLSMFVIFASADETQGGETDTEGSVSSDFKLLYNRTFDEGWGVDNGLKIYDQTTGDGGHTLFVIDHEDDEIDFTKNYFWRLELNSNDNDYAALNFTNNANIGTVLEFDVKSDDICNFANVIHFATPGDSGSRNSYDFMRVVDNKVYLMSNGAHVGGSSEPAFELTNSWTRIQLIFDFTYQKNEIGDDIPESEKNALELENSKYFLMYIYIGPADGSAPMELWTGEPLLMYGNNGKGIQYFRFQSTGADRPENYGTSICFDNMKAYDGVNEIVEITKDMGYGTLVNAGGNITEDIEGGSGSTDVSTDLYSVLSMKIGVDYCYLNKTRTPLETAKDGEIVYGAPVIVNGEVMIPLSRVLEYVGYPYYLHPDLSAIDITTGDYTSYLKVGKSEATVAGELVSLNAAPAFATVDIDGAKYSYLTIALSDVETILPGYYGDYDDMGYMTVSNNPDLLDRNVNLSSMIAVMKEFVFDYYTPEGIYEDVNEYTNGFQHPYILANGEQLDMLYNEYQALLAKEAAGEIEELSEEYWMLNHYDRIVASGESAYKHYALPDANGTYEEYNGLAPDPKDDDGNNLRGKTSLEQNYLEPGAEGYDIGGRSDIANRTHYLETMTFAYAITRDVKYLKLCYEIALCLSEWTHWGPGHFLNCADSSNDFAIYFDWTYNGYLELAAKGETCSTGEVYDVKVLAEILARQGVHEGYNSTNKIYDHVSPVVGQDGGYYSERVNNWAAVCVGGMTVASLAILGDVDEQYVKEATFILSENFKSLVKLGLDIYAPDGSYIEGPGYWSYGTNNFFRMCAALDSATGGNYGLMDCWGMDTTCYYACHTEDNDSRYFPFHDGHVGNQDTSYFFYVANYFNDATLYDVRLNQINGGSKFWNATLVDMIYYPRGIEIDADEIDLDYYSDNIDLFATRSGWESGALFASMIGGANKVSHGQIDAGDFVYHNGGNIWIYDLGTEEYNCPGFWPDSTRYRYYVMKPEGNNTVAISTDPAGVPYGQTLGGVADAYAWGSNEHGSYVTYDMGDSLGAQVIKWERGMLLTNDRKTTVIQDQMTFRSVQTVYWFAHYSTSYVDKVEISKDGRTAYMKEYIGKDEHGKDLYQTLRLSLISTNKTLKFEIMDCYTFIHTTGNNATYTVQDVAKLGSVPERSRKDYKKLAICSGEVLDFDVAVVIELVDTDTVGKNTEIDVGYSMTTMNGWTPYADTRGIKVEDTGNIVRRGIPNVDKHLVQGIAKIQAIEGQGLLYTDKVKEYYRSLTDAYYAVRTLGVDMPAGHEAEIAALKQYREDFAAYRSAIIDLQKGQLNFVYKLMSMT